MTTRTENAQARQPGATIVLLLLALPLVLLPAAAAQQCPEPVWADEFDGAALDESKWSYQLGDGCDVGLCGWGNNELEYYQAGNAVVSGGTLKIIAREQQAGTRAYTSARIRTVGQGDWTFGRFEARIKLPRGQGLWPAFWMLPTDEVYGGWPQSGELDIMEAIGREPGTVHGTIHFGDPWPNNSSSAASFTLHDGAFADRFHTFAVEREPGVVRWLVDDFVYAVGTPADVAPHVWPFDERFHFILNLAVGGDWPGAPDATTTFPQRLEVDWVRVWDGNRPHVAGSRQALRGETGVTYEIGNPLPGTSVDWRVPRGAVIVSGQGSRRLTVNWGKNGGDVVAEVTSRCGEARYAVAVAVAEPEVVLDMPNQLQVTVLTPSAALATWNDRSDGETAFELIARGPAGGWQKVATAGADAERVVLKRLTPGTRYQLRVRARDGVRVSRWSPKRVLDLPELLPRPKALKATALSPTAVRLTWRDRSIGEDAYEIGRRAVPGTWEEAAEVGANVEQVDLTGLLPATTYVFRVRARGDGTLSEWRQARVVTPPP